MSRKRVAFAATLDARGAAARVAGTALLVLAATAGALGWQRLALTGLSAGLLSKLVSQASKAAGTAQGRRLGAAPAGPSRSRSADEESGGDPGQVERRDSQPLSVGYTWEEVRPPLPPQVVALLRATRLGYLSTASAAGDGSTAASPHLSLMNFTYVPGDEVIVMTTRRDTLKYKNLLSMPRVALLVHDFPTARGAEQDNSFSRTYSITLYGSVHKPQDTEQEERFRALHLENNPSSRCFIVGDNVAVLIIGVESARLCNSEDKVTTWSVDRSPAAATPIHR